MPYQKNRWIINPQTNTMMPAPKPFHRTKAGTDYERRVDDFLDRLAPAIGMEMGPYNAIEFLMDSVNGPTDKQKAVLLKLEQVLQDMTAEQYADE